MTKLSKTLTSLLLVSLANIFSVIPVLALIPPLPSSFYGTVKVNGENVVDGTTVTAIINGRVYATGYTQTYQGTSVYSVDVPGDDASSTEVEGGRDGEVIQFEIAGVMAVEAGVWKSATNTSLNLTASVAGTLNTPQPTPTSVPTQTPIKPPKKSLTSTTPVESLPTEPAAVVESGSTITAAPELAVVSTQPAKPSGDSMSDIPTDPVQAPPIPAQPIPLGEGGSINYFIVIAFIILLAVIVAWVFRFYFKSHSSKKR